MSDESLTKGQCIALEKVDGICNAMNCTPNEMIEFVPNNTESMED